VTDLVRLKAVYARMLIARYSCTCNAGTEVLDQAAKDLEVVMLSMGATPVEIGEIVREVFTT
jgi:hypothetical protein